ncbi:MAG: anhydro-N-acetylmuramic acid kinase [Pseudomonadales bacterium]|nr:anhydro-N-acetylmuramic acid kinase [Pseudomonadales bacterium]
MGSGDLNSKDLYIGLISGTSADGIDAALVSFEHSQPRLLAHHLHPIPPEVRERLVSLFTPSDLQVDLMGELDIAMGRLFAEAAQTLLEHSNTPAAGIRAIGSHGQTIRHRPVGKHPFTLQIGDPNVISQQTGIDVIADFRRRDMACGGQGAPLAPLFHQSVLSSAQETRVVLNLGGIANITLLPREGLPLAMDTGPASGLMDSWCQLHKGEAYDCDGDWAAQGKVIDALVSKWLSDPYFSLAAPKSTGKEYFHLPWAKKMAGAAFGDSDPADVQASFLELTAKSIANAIQDLPMKIDRVLVCGGGAHNKRLMNRLQDLIQCPLEPSEKAGIAGDWVEAMCFAWLAKCYVDNNKLETGPFTGAKEAALLGGMFKA